MENHTQESVLKCRRDKYKETKYGRNFLKSVLGLLKEVHLYVQASVNNFKVSIMYVSRVSEDSVYEHWFYGISEEAREWLIQIDLIVRDKRGNSIPVFVICEPDQCTKCQYN